MKQRLDAAPHVFRLVPPSLLDFTWAEGSYVFDASGQAYLDFESGCWATSLGHQHPAMLHAMQQQMQQIIHLGTRYPNHTVEEAALAILDISGIGSEGQSLLLASGSEAVEFAVQAAGRVNKKAHYLVLGNSYMAAFGSSHDMAAPVWITFDWRACETCADQQCKDCPQLANLDFSAIAAFVFESGSFAGQVKFPPSALVHELAARMHTSGGLVVSNEITAGMGRTGRWFGYQHYDIQPDLVAAGKGLGNGYPVSAVAMTGKVADALQQSGMKYAQSHQNDPLGAAVATAVIRAICDENLLQNCTARGEQLMQGLCEIKNQYPVITAVRGRGLLIAIECADPVCAESLYESMLQKHVLVGYKPDTRIIRFFPPLTVSADQVNTLLDLLKQSLQEM